MPQNDKSKKAEAEPERTKAQKQKSFKIILGYARNECWSIVLGLVFLLGGSLSDLTMPLFVGRVVDLMNKEDYDKIATLCVYMIIINTVSSSHSFILTIIL